MTEQDTATPVETPESAVDESLGEGEGIIPAEPHKGNKEARYRVERNSARAEVETLQSRLAVLQRAEIERLASADLSHASDIFVMSGNTVSDYLTDAGTVDAAKVAADVAAILAERPGLKPPASAVDRTQGLHSPQKHEPTWESMFQS